MSRDAAPQFAPGFRLSVMDLVILLMGAVAAITFSRVDTWLGIAIAFVVAHFFLFCNVLRMSRMPELIWAAAFISLAVGSMYGFLSWPYAFAGSAVVTCVLATIEIRRNSYHGIGWQVLNPQLPTWFAQQFGTSANSLFIVPAEVRRGTNCRMPAHFVGAVVPCLTAAPDHLSAVKRAVDQLQADGYIFKDLAGGQVRQLDPTGWEQYVKATWPEFQADLPSQTQILNLLQTGGVLFGPFATWDK